MIRICMDCGAEMGEKEDEGVTHGVCDDCLTERLKRKIYEVD